MQIPWGARGMVMAKIDSCINKDASKESFNCAETQGIHHRIKSFMFPIQLFPTECLFGEMA